MKLRTTCSLFLVVGLLAAGGSVQAQNPDLKPTFGSTKLKTGFVPDPFVQKLAAGGEVKTDKGGVQTNVANPPDFILEYEAGTLPLTIHAESRQDITLLIRTPDGKWVANDDRSDTNLNPLIKFANPKSGRYVIWVGTLNGKLANSRLKITELPVQ